MSDINQNIKSEDFSCPNCGGKTSFNPKTQLLECLYCNSVIDVNNSDIVTEKTLDVLFSQTTEWNDSEVIKCNNCGCQEVVTKGQISNSCSFCGTNNIIKTSQICGMKPHGLCPFEVTLLDAKRIISAWIGKKKFLPNKFKKTARSKDLRGVYSPAFTFDCNTNTTYSGTLGETEYYTVTGADGKSERRSRTRTFSISGTYLRNFDDLIVQASSNIPELTLDKLSPFPTGKAVEYDEKYLAGFSANTYSKNGRTSWYDGQKKMEAKIRKEILRKYDYDTIYRFDAKTNYSDVSFKYLLLPVYVGHHSFKSKNYNFYINGSTGKIEGKTPVSGWKIFGLIMGILGSIGCIALLILLISSMFV